MQQAQRDGDLNAFQILKAWIDFVQLYPTDRRSVNWATEQGNKNTAANMRRVMPFARITKG